MEGRHDTRCPQCKRFVGKDADGFYDRLVPSDETSEVAAFCDETCARRYRAHHPPRFAKVGGVVRKAE